jgi:hypothetical protein
MSKKDIEISSRSSFIANSKTTPRIAHIADADSGEKPDF